MRCYHLMTLILEDEYFVIVKLNNDAKAWHIWLNNGNATVQLVNPFMCILLCITNAAGRRLSNELAVSIKMKKKNLLSL